MADLELQAGVLSRLIKHTEFAAGKSDERYLMTCVSFRGVESRRGIVIEAAATDGWCLAVARGPGEGVGQVNFPAKALSRLRLTWDAEEFVTIRESEGRVQVIEGTRRCADEPLQAGTFPAYDDTLSQVGEPTAVVSISDARTAMREVIQRAAYVELISRDGSLMIAAAKRSVPVACDPKQRRDASVRVSGRHLARAIAHCGDGEIALYLGRSLLLLKGHDFDFLLAGLPDPDGEKYEQAEKALRDPSNAGLSDRQLAKVVGVSHTHIKDVRNDLLLAAPTMRTACRRGKTYHIETARIGRTRICKPRRST